MLPQTWLLVALGLPLVAFLGCIVFSRVPNLREASSLLVAVSLFAVTLMIAAGEHAVTKHSAAAGEQAAGEHSETGEHTAAEHASPADLAADSADLAADSAAPKAPSESLHWTAGEMLPGFEFAFRVEPLGAMFACVSSGLWILTTLYAIGYMRAHHEEHQSRFFACFALAIFAAVAAAYSANLFTLFVAYEVMTLSTYPLVTHHGTVAARNGGRVYMGILLSTSIALFMLAIAWTWQVAGSLDFQVGGILTPAYQSGALTNTTLGVLLGLFAFGIGKAALMPFHRWLPAAMVAPTPVSALLHAVAVVKVGVFTVLKVVVFIFGLELLQTSGVSIWLAYVAAITLLIASLVAMTKDNLKARLAYSTVSQLAYITLGAALATQASVLGAGMHIAMHAVGKITLFFCAGAIYVASHETQISKMRGLGRKMPYTFGAFLLATVSIIGLPPGGGAWSKWLLTYGTVETHHYLLTAALMISTLLNIAYLVPIGVCAFQMPEGDQRSSEIERHEAPWACVFPLCLSAVGSVALFFFAESIYQFLLPIVGKG